VRQVEVAVSKLRVFDVEPPGVLPYEVADGVHLVGCQCGPEQRRQVPI
jgi:hypothetical protein